MACSSPPATTKVSLTVKTLDSENHPYADLDEEMTIKDLKTRIASDVDIPSNRQRLIYCGRVLQDDKKIKEYELDGKVLHLVSRAPPSLTGGPDNVAASEARARYRRPQLGTSNPTGGVNVMIHHGSTAFRSSGTSETGLTSPSVRLGVANRMLRLANYVIDRMENPTAETVAAPETNNGGSSEGERFSVTAIPIGTMTIQFEHNGFPLNTSEALTNTSMSDMLQQRFLRRTRLSPNGANRARVGNPETSTEPSSGLNEETPPEIEYPPTSNLVETMAAYTRTSSRLSSHWERLSTLLSEDSEVINVSEHQTFYNNVTSVMHYMSHAQHAMSDIQLNFSLPPPRVLRARPVFNIVQQSIVTNGGLRSSSSSSSNNEMPMETNGFDAEPIMVGIEIPTSGSTSDSSTPSDDLFQNVIHSTLTGIQQAFHRAPSSSRPSPPSTEQPSGTNGSARTQPTTSTRTRSSPQVYYATSANLGAPPNVMPNNCFDFFLQCNSHHIGSGNQNPGRWMPFDHHHAIRRRTRHPAGFQIHHSRSSSVPAPAVTSTINTTTTSSSSNTNSATASAQSSPTVPRRTTPTVVPIVEPSLGVLINQIINPSTSTQNSNSDGSGDQIMLTMIQGVLRNVVGALGLGFPTSSSTEQSSVASGNQTVEQFLRSLPDYNYVAGESFVTDLLMTLAQTLTFRDLVAWVFGGGDAILDQLHVPLRNFVHTQLGGPSNEVSIQRLIDEWYSKMEEVAAVASVKPGIDFAETLHSFFSVRMASLIQFIESETSSDFGRSLSTMVREMAIDATALGLHCFVDGPASLERVVQNRLVALFDDGFGSIVREWTMSVATGHLRNYIAGLEQSSSEANISEFVVHNGEDADKRKEERQNRQERTPKESKSVASLLLPTPPPALECNQRFPSSLLPSSVESSLESNEVWHRTVPSDWVPIIDRDIGRQSQQGGSTSDDERSSTEQSPYSDAYLSSQPAKRRKLTASKKPERNSGIESIIVESLNEALEETGIAIHADSVENIAANRDVCKSVEVETRKIIKKKLEKDPDFVESATDRFPASKAFLHENEKNN